MKNTFTKKQENLISKQDGLSLAITIIEPKIKAKGIVQISHGMAEHKERYEDFMKYLASEGYIIVIHDHRGHGKSVKREEDLGYFYSDEIDAIVDDLYQVTTYIKEKYQNLDVILFSHSMGTLVSRCYLKKYASEIKKLILCGPPTKNNLVTVGIFLAKLGTLLGKSKTPNKFLNQLTFGNYNKNLNIENEWICSDIKTVTTYNTDKLCGFIFTTNGFLNLYKMMKASFNKNNWVITNPKLSIYIIAGKADPVIQNEKKFYQLVEFLKSVGYQNITTKLYPGKRHELLNELNHEEVYQDILAFIQKERSK